MVVERSDKEREEKNDEATLEEAGGWAAIGVAGGEERGVEDPAIAVRNS